MKSETLSEIDWSSLSARNGDASFVMKELAALYQDPNDTDRFNRLWPELCSEGTTWSSAYAAAPFILELARKTDSKPRFTYLYVLSLFRQCEFRHVGSDSHFHCTDEFRRSYELALKSALPLLAEISDHDFGSDTSYFLSAIATFKGQIQLASCIERIAAEDYKCPECQELLG